IGCDKNTDGPEGSNQNSFDLQYGNIRFDFPLDDKYGAGRCTKRTDLSISYTADSLYRKEYLTSANLSDYQGTYTFILKPGKYFYQAGKVCLCGGDTCLWNGYPGGQMGVQWTMGWFTIEVGKSIDERITFVK
ncbi:MAG: hypothetical protein U9N86_13955, partial [Bacteroidota bacterium]|nr:hypothetical protein [Bacteroidota bacterium]